MEFQVIYCLIGVIVLIVLVFLASALKIVAEYQRLVVFRLGRCIGPKGPGLVILIPFIDRAVRVDLREQVREIQAYGRGIQQHQLWTAHESSDNSKGFLPRARQI